MKYVIPGPHGEVDASEHTQLEDKAALVRTNQSDRVPSASARLTRGHQPPTHPLSSQNARQRRDAGKTEGGLEVVKNKLARSAGCRANKKRLKSIRYIEKSKLSRLCLLHWKTTKRALPGQRVQADALANRERPEVFVPLENHPGHQLVLACHILDLRCTVVFF